MTSVINRYYDPTTDQFLSIDPHVAQTDQPYLYAGDDPLNAEDPLGLLSRLAQAEKYVVASAKAASKATVYADAAASAQTKNLAVHYATLAKASAKTAANDAREASSIFVLLPTDIYSTPFTPAGEATSYATTAQQSASSANDAAINFGNHGFFGNEVVNTFFEGCAGGILTDALASGGATLASPWTIAASCGGGAAAAYES